MGYAVEAIRSVPDSGRFSKCFIRMFNVEVADTDELRRDAFRLRYRVYCEERQFERSEHFPDRLESDEFDDGAVHAIVRHRETGIVVGAVRLILRHHADPKNRLPLEQACDGLLDRAELSKFDGYQHSVAEVSRFAVSKGAIAEVAECARTSSAADVADDAIRNVLGGNPFQNVVLGLISALFQMSAACGIDHWYALMEPSLARHLSRLGLRFTRVGPLVNHRGKRQPMLANLWGLRQDILDQNPQLHELIEFNGAPVAQRTQRAVRVRWSQGIFTSIPSFAEAAWEPS